MCRGLCKIYSIDIVEILEIVLSVLVILYTLCCSIDTVESPTDSSKDTGSVTAMRRQRFARRQSSIGAMVMTSKFDDNEMRRRFRTYEI